MFKRLLITLSLCVLTGSAIASSQPADVILVVHGSAITDTSRQEALETVIEATTEGLDGESRFGVFEFDEKSNQQSPLEPVRDGMRQKLLASLLLSSDRHDAKLNPATALEKAIYQLRIEGRSGSEKIIIMLGDGIERTDDETQYARLSQWLRQELSGEARQAGIKIFWLTLSESADYQVIQNITQKTGGQYFRAFGPEATRVAILSILSRVGMPANSDVLSTGAIDKQVASDNGALDEDGALLSQIKEHSGILIAGFGVLGVILLAVVFQVKRRSGTHPEEPKAGRRAEDRKVTLRDMSEFTAVKEYDITARRTYIGRLPREVTEHSCVIVIRDTSVGRNHASIEYRDNAYWAVDHGTVNGTYINDKRLHETQKLKSGDRIRFARFEFMFNIPASMAETKSPHADDTIPGKRADNITTKDDDRTIFRSRRH
jgi:hypothetical protein